MELLLGLGLEIFENRFLEKLLERFLGLGLEMLKNSSLEAFWFDFWAWAWKFLKIASWKDYGTIFGPGPGNA